MNCSLDNQTEKKEIQKKSDCKEKKKRVVSVLRKLLDLSLI